jgi:8-oxo-dGTP diphosphatase
MDDWQQAPVFGVRQDGVHYTVRPSAYALIRNTGGQVAVVRTSVGTFLPGGGIEDGETPEQAIVREALEECAFIIRPAVWMTRAVQFVYSLAELTYFEKQSTFFDAQIESWTSMEIEADHELVWVSPETAARMLSHESHEWAIERWVEATK